MVYLYINPSNISYLYIMIEIPYSFIKKDLNKIKKYKNPTLDIDKNMIKEFKL